MAEAFIFENWQHVFEPSLNINETWDRWKEQFFKEVKSFIEHEIKIDNHEKTTSKSAKWFNKDICRLIRAKIDCTAEQQHLGRATIGRFTVLLAIKQLMQSCQGKILQSESWNPGEPKLSSIQVVAIGQRTLWSEWKKFNNFSPTSYLSSGHCEKRSRKGQSPESYLYQPKHLPQPRRFSNWSNAIEICVYHPGYLPSWCQKNHQVFTKQSFFWFWWDFVSPS